MKDQNYTASFIGY